MVVCLFTGQAGGDLWMVWMDGEKAYAPSSFWLLESSFSSFSYADR